MSISDALHPTARSRTTLLTVAVALAGGVAYSLLPVSPLPQVDFPTISVSASLPGASPETMASSVATPLERQFGRIAGVTEMTSTSYLGSTSITLQFDLNRNIDAAARDVQAAINAAPRLSARRICPAIPRYRKVNPADAPILILALTSDVVPRGQMYDAASIDPGAEAVAGARRRPGDVGGSSLPAVRVELNPTAAEQLRHRPGRCAHRARQRQRQRAQRAISPTSTRRWAIDANDQLFKAERLPAADRRLPQRRAGAAVRHRPTVDRFGRRHPQRRAVPTASRRC